jgi:hypothetical protein
MSTLFLILGTCYLVYVLWCDWRRTKELRKLCHRLRDTIENNRWRHAERWYHHRINIDWRSLENQEHMMEVIRQLREGPPKEREKVNWQREGF